MEESLAVFFADRSWLLLIGLIAAIILVLVKAADALVQHAVVLSERSGMPKIIVGTTIVSLGTTTPEAAVSVLAALQGNPGLALGNAVGSIICDTGMILGIACLIAPLPLPRQIVNRQGWIQLAAGLLLIVCCWPWVSPMSAFSEGGNLAQYVGILFLALLGGYLWLSVHWAKQAKDSVSIEEFEGGAQASTAAILTKLVVAIILVVLASWLLIPAVEEAAIRLQVPKAIIAATLVAFGTSLPELVTAVTASRKGHGDLAIGNIIGADILNVLFVAGAAAAVTPGGLDASTDFFRVLFPAMLSVLVIFRIGVFVSGDHLKRSFGFVLLAAYLVYLVVVTLFRTVIQQG